MRLDRLGLRVYAGVRTEAQAQELRTHGSGRITPVLLDVTDEACVSAAAALITEGQSGLDGLVNNAGVAVGGPLEHLPLQAWREQLEVNVLGQVAVTKAMLPLIRAGGGRIVFMGSISGKIATMMTGPYCASKFALEAISESLRHELHPWRIHVSVIEPGAVKTPIWDKARQDADDGERELPAQARADYARHITAIRKDIDMQARHGTHPQRVARAVEHALLSPRPKTRYLVGADARIQNAMLRWLPDKPREAIIRKIAGP
jgi:NAD(P)-dependent dehydrogenase (short-subunit alcohol dehydrogenase family)